MFFEKHFFVRLVLDAAQGAVDVNVCGAHKLTVHIRPLLPDEKRADLHVRSSAIVITETRRR